MMEFESNTVVKLKPFLSDSRRYAIQTEINKSVEAASLNPCIFINHMSPAEEERSKQTS
jgi:hypothetical protein